MDVKERQRGHRAMARTNRKCEACASLRGSGDWINLSSGTLLCVADVVVDVVALVVCIRDLHSYLKSSNAEWNGK